MNYNEDTYLKVTAEVYENKKAFEEGSESIKLVTHGPAHLGSTIFRLIRDEYMERLRHSGLFDSAVKFVKDDIARRDPKKSRMINPN